MTNLDTDLENLHKLQCSKCKEWKRPSIGFAINNANKARGFAYHCKICMSMAGTSLAQRNRLYLQAIENNGVEHELRKLHKQSKRLEEKKVILKAYIKGTKDP